MCVPEYEVCRLSAAARRMSLRGHRMAIDQEAPAKLAPSLRDQCSEHVVERLPAGPYPTLRIGEQQLVTVDPLAGCHDTRDRTQPGADTGARGVDPGRQLISEHGW